MERIYMTAYDVDSIPNDDITDGLNFSTDEPFFLICNKPISGKMYFEFTISSYYPISSYHNIPIYAGISKEPSFGVLNADFCIGSLFYRDGEEYDIESKYNATAENYHGYPEHIHTRIPGATDIIGVAVDVYNNLISFYVNGELFYSFNPPLFNMKEEGNLYFCIFGNTYYKSIRSDHTYRSGDDVYEETKKIVGWCNFGKNQLQYLPYGYYSIYGMYFRRIEVDSYIDCDIDVDALPYWESIGDVNCDCIVDALIGDDRSIYLLTNNDNVTVDELDYRISHNELTDYMLYGGNAMINLPIPVERKIYLEFTARSATVEDKSLLGIPLSIGISDTLYTIANCVLKAKLHHYVNHRYEFSEIQNMIETPHTITNVLSTTVPEQGTIIGVAIDLANNKFDIYVDMVLFATIKAIDTDWSDQSHLAYFFIHDDGIFDDEIHGVVNVGKESFDMTIPDGYISLWDYYNKLPDRFTWADIDVTVDVENAFKCAAYIYCDAYVNTIKMPTDKTKYETPSINAVMGTFNSVTDTIEHHYEPDTSMTKLNAIIANDNEGYYPGIIENEMNKDFIDDGSIVYYTVNIKQSEHQTIYVHYNGTVYTDSFRAEENSEISITLIADNGYDAGKINTTPKFNITKDISIYATEPSLTQYKVVIVQSDHQTITVTCNGKEYTQTFATTKGQNFTVSIEADEGYIAGKLSATSGTISRATSIFASEATIKTYQITFTQPEHQKIEIVCDNKIYTSSFIAPYGSAITINVVDVDYGYTMNTDFDRFYDNITDSLTLAIPDAIVQICTLIVENDTSICEVRINNIIGSTFNFHKGDEVTIEALPDDGYYISSIELESSDE